MTAPARSLASLTFLSWCAADRAVRASGGTDQLGLRSRQGSAAGGGAGGGSRPAEFAIGRDADRRHRRRGPLRVHGAAAGTYVVQVYLSGFEVQSSPAIVLGAEQSATHDVVLALAGESQSITVVGTASPGYRVDTASIGSLAATSILETPYMVNVLPASLIANNQAKSFKEASRYLPLIGFQEQQGSEVLRPQTRGMQGANMQNSRMDGMGIVITGANSMEMLQQIEVLNGLGGALYGPANPSGMFNFVPKRPTERPVRQVSVSYDGQFGRPGAHRRWRSRRARTRCLATG